MFNLSFFITRYAISTLILSPLCCYVKDSLQSVGNSIFPLCYEMKHPRFGSLYKREKSWARATLLFWASYVYVYIILQNDEGLFSSFSLALFLSSFLKDYFTTWIFCLGPYAIYIIFFAIFIVMSFSYSWTSACFIGSKLLCCDYWLVSKGSKEAASFPLVVEQKLVFLLLSFSKSSCYRCVI